MSRALTAAFVAELAIIGWRDTRNYGLLPLPADIAGAAVIFGLLGLVPESGARAAATFGWALVIAAYLNLWNPSSPTHLGAAQPVSAGTAPATNT